MEVRFHGRASHSGMYPEEGRSAIAAAARAIADLRLGRIDEETTANVGMITGGTAGEHRPGVVHVRRRGALARRGRSSRDVVQEMLDAIAVRGQRRATARSRRRCARATGATGSSATDEVVRLACGALVARRPASRSFALSGGAADANVFNERGLAVRQPRERHGRDPHARRAHRRRRPRGDGRRHAGARRRGALPLSLRRGRVTADRSSGTSGSYGWRSTATPASPIRG